MEWLKGLRAQVLGLVFGGFTVGLSRLAGSWFRELGLGSAGLFATLSTAFSVTVAFPKCMIVLEKCDRVAAPLQSEAIWIPKRPMVGGFGF